MQLILHCLNNIDLNIDTVLLTYLVLLSAKDLVRKLLTVNESERISVDDALEHPWLQVCITY